MSLVSYYLHRNFWSAFALINRLSESSCRGIWQAVFFEPWYPGAPEQVYIDVTVSCVWKYTTSYYLQFFMIPVTFSHKLVHKYLIKISVNLWGLTLKIRPIITRIHFYLSLMGWKCVIVEFSKIRLHICMYKQYTSNYNP